MTRLAKTIFACLDLVALSLLATAQKRDDAAPPPVEQVMAQAANARRAYVAKPDNRYINAISIEKLKDALIGKMSDKGWRLSKEEEHLLRWKRPTTQYDDAPIIAADILLYPKDSGVNVKFSFFGDRTMIDDDDLLSAKIDILQSLDDICKTAVQTPK